jgi:membrane protein YqaA with SNARE-associated domain
MMLSLAIFTLKHTAWQWLRRIGGPGLIAVGIIDSSVIPFPGGMDFFTILLAMSHPDLWWYYAIWATIGSTIGSYFTYRMGAKGGEETLEKKLSTKRAKKVYAMFEKHGFLTVAVGALLPPPVPIAPFFLAPGVMKYPLRKFFAAVLTGRSIRYAAIAYLGSIYGRSVLRWSHRYYTPILYIVVGLAVVGALVGLYYWRRSKQHQKQEAGEPAPSRKAA